MSGGRSTLVKALVDELGGVRHDVMQVSTAARSKVDSIDDERAAELGQQLRRDVAALGARYDALLALSQQSARGDVLDAFERKLNATDAMLDAVEEMLFITEGLDPVVVPVDSELDNVRFGGLPAADILVPKAEPKDESLPVSQDLAHTSVGAAAPRGSPPPLKAEAKPMRTPLRPYVAPPSLVTPARPPPRFDTDSLPPTPKLADFGITDASIPGLLGRGLDFNGVSANTRVAVGAGVDAVGNGGRVHVAKREQEPHHVVQQATSPAQEEDVTYDESVTRQMRRMEFRKSILGAKEEVMDEVLDDGDVTYDESISRQMEELGFDDETLPISGR